MGHQAVSEAKAITMDIKVVVSSRAKVGLTGSVGREVELMVDMTEGDTKLGITNDPQQEGKKIKSCIDPQHMRMRAPMKRAVWNCRMSIYLQIAPAVLPEISPRQSSIRYAPRTTNACVAPAPRPTSARPFACAAIIVPLIGTTAISRTETPVW